LGQASNMLACIPSGMVRWRTKIKGNWLTKVHRENDWKK